MGIISKLQDSLPCASIFGNHDVAYLSKLYRNRKLPRDAWAPPDEEDTDPNSSCSASAQTLRPRLGLGKQYSAGHERHARLERSNVAWGRRDGDDVSLSGAGGRPFRLAAATSWPTRRVSTKTCSRGMMVSSSARGLSRETSEMHLDGFANVVLAHNGPTGLGEASDIVGRDWQPRGRKQRDDPADWGDADLEAGLASASEGAHVPLVVFGHMHHALRDGGERRMALHDPSHNRLYLNAAHVPRWRRSTRVVSGPSRWSSWVGAVVATAMRGRRSWPTPARSGLPPAPSLCGYSRPEKLWRSAPSGPSRHKRKRRESPGAGALSDSVCVDLCTSRLRERSAASSFHRASFRRGFSGLACSNH